MTSRKPGSTRSPRISARRALPRAPVAPGCGTAQQPTALEWPAGEIDARLHPNDSQRASLAALQDASTKAAETLRTACQPRSLTPPARFTAMARRLDTMLQAVKLVRATLEDFYATLSDEQKAQFEAIGQNRPRNFHPLLVPRKISDVAKVGRLALHSALPRGSELDPDDLICQ